MKNLLELYRQFFSKIGIALIVYTICRLLFYFFNFSSFEGIDLRIILGGIRFDLMTITWVYAPFILTFLFLKNKAKKVCKVLFHFSNSLSIILNVIDFEYFKFTLKRTSSDLFTTSGLGNDILSLLPQYLIDYWYLILIIALLIYLSNWAYDKTEKSIPVINKWILKIIYPIPIIILLVIGSRGGTQLRPLGLLSAGEYGTVNQVPLVFSTPFSILKTLYKKDLKPKNYFLDEELAKIYQPIQAYPSDSIKKKLNVVLIIAESFSKEYVDYNQNGISFTPFLDSLINEGVYFENAFANGRKSIEALPAIISGIPSLMPGNYISSKYASNQIESLSKTLKDIGYSTHFFHGGANGTMGFQAFTQMAEIENYYGRDEYPSIKDFDGNWGVFDLPFLQFTAQELNTAEKPFFAGIFTLSSHHPYTTPLPYDTIFEEGPVPILKSIKYADLAIKRFFESAQKEDWFDETVFVITADHSSESIDLKYASRSGMYAIPLLFYCPKYLAPKRETKTAQQSDIYPSLIDLLDIQEPILAYGNSLFDSSKTNFSVTYINDSYQLIQENYSLLYDGNEVIGFYDFYEDPLFKNNRMKENHPQKVEMLSLLKGIIQDYNFRLINNKLSNY